MILSIIQDSTQENITPTIIFEDDQAISGDRIERDCIQSAPLSLVEDGYLKIQTKNIESGGLTPLIPNRPQRRFLKLFKELRVTGEQIRIAILKARQWGGTTITDAIMYAYASQQSNIHGMIIADDSKGSSYILGMARGIHEHMEADYPHLVPKSHHSNRLELSFTGTKSIIYIDTGENEAAGQKYTLHYLHCSEVAKFHYTDTLFKGLFPAVAKVPGAFIVLESTANGSGDYWHRLVLEAQAGTSNWALFFVPWMEHEEYSIPFSEQEKQALLSSLNDEEEVLLSMEYETIDGMLRVTPEQLNWRRRILVDEFHGDLDSFHEMYPATIEEAFLTSGRPAFNATKLQSMYSYVISQPQPDIGDLVFATQADIGNSNFILTLESVLFDPNKRGNWQIWELPDTAHEYVIGVDPAGGEEVEGIVEGKNWDFGDILVFRRGYGYDNKMYQVAQYRSRIDPDLLADEVYFAYMAYGKSAIMLEVNNHGRTTADHLKHRALVWHREIFDEQTKKRTKKIGWYTSPGQNGTKKLMINALGEAIRDNWIVVRSPILAKECQTYVVASNGTTNAQSGCYDDTVMAAALAVQAHIRLPRRGAYKAVQTVNLGSVR